MKLSLIYHWKKFVIFFIKHMGNDAPIVNSTPMNLQMICHRCNTRKGPLTHRNFKRLLTWLKHQDKDLERYVLKKMSSRGF